MSLLTTLAGNRVAKSVVGGALNVLPGYSTLGANISNPNVNYQGVANPSSASSTNGSASVTASAPSAASNQTSGVYDPAADAKAAAAAQYGDPAQYDSQIQAYQSQIGNLDPSIGLQNNQDNYQKQRNSLLQDEADADRQYQANTQQNTQSFQANRTKALNATRSNANALQRLLGMNGAGNSSAAFEQAPYAAALQGSQDVNAAQQTFGANAQNLDLANTSNKRKFQDSEDDLNTQKYQSDNSVRSQIAQSRADLLDKIATASVQRNLANGLTGTAAQSARNQYQPQIEQLLQQVQGLGKGYATPIQAKAVETTPLTLSDYAQGKQVSASNGENAGGDDIGNNFLSSLTQKRDKFGSLIPSY